MSYQEEWQTIVNTANRKSALTEHFKYLADTPGAHKHTEWNHRKSRALYR
jgi:hypothetical protein